MKEQFQNRLNRLRFACETMCSVHDIMVCEIRCNARKASEKVFLNKSEKLQHPDWHFV